MPPGVGPGRSVGRLVELEPLQQVDRAASDLGAGQVVQAADEGQVLAPGEVGVDRRELAGQADHRSELARIAYDVVARDRRAARVGREEGGQDPDRGRLAGAVRTEQAQDGALLDAQVDAGEGVDVPVRLGQAERFDREGHRDCLLWERES